MPAASTAQEAATGAPVVTVIDGDTLELAGRRYNLFAIDAPELAQTCAWPGKTIPCGELARLAMMDLVAGADDVRCKPLAGENGAVAVAICTSGGYDIGWNMVHTGWALADRKVSADYVAKEEEARKARRGLWRGTFTPPWEWRRQNHVP